MGNLKQTLTTKQLKIAYVALEKAQMSGDIISEELALAYIDLIDGSLDGMGIFKTL